jgi:hypothetical protein
MENSRQDVSRRLWRKEFRIVVMFRLPLRRLSLRSVARAPASERVLPRWAVVVLFTVGIVGGSVLSFMIAVYCAARIQDLGTEWVLPPAFFLAAFGMGMSVRRELRNRNILIAGAYAGASASLVLVAVFEAAALLRGHL